MASGGVAEFVTPLCVHCVCWNAPVNTLALCHTNTQKEPCVNSGWELPRHVFLLFYGRNSEKHISLTCKCDVPPLDVSIHSCCLPDAAVARCVALIFYLRLLNSFIAQYRMSQKPKEETGVWRKWIKRETQRTTWNANVVQERKCWNRRQEKKLPGTTEQWGKLSAPVQ